MTGSIHCLGRLFAAALPLLLVAAAPSAPQTAPRWVARHEQKLQEILQKAPEVIFVGDSITEELENDMPRFGDIAGVWQRFYVCRNAENLGFAGDTTGNALWRLQHGEIDGIHPRLAVVLIGTNDLIPMHGGSPADAAAGVRAVVTTLHDRLPGTRILLIGLLPRERLEPQRAQVNQTLARADWAGLNTTYVSADAALVRDGMPDPTLYREGQAGRPLLHPNGAGWQRIAELIEPEVARLLGDRRGGVHSGGVCAAG